MLSSGHTEDEFDPDTLIWLEADEQVIVYGFILSLKGGMNGAEVDYTVTERFSAKHDLDPIDMFGLFRKMAAEFNAGTSPKTS